MPHRTPNTILHNAVLNVFCQAGELVKAKELFEQMHIFPYCLPNTSSYNTVLTGWSKSSNGDRAERLLNDMITTAVVIPDTASYNTVLNTHAQAGHVVRALNFFQNHIPPSNLSVVTFGIILHALSRRRRRSQQHDVVPSEIILDDDATDRSRRLSAHSCVVLCTKEIVGRVVRPKEYKKRKKGVFQLSLSPSLLVRGSSRMTELYSHRNHLVLLWPKEEEEAMAQEGE